MIRQEALPAFTALLEEEQLEMLVKRNVDCEGNRIGCRVKIVQGNKYTRVNVGNSGKYMAVNATGEIYGIKGYGVIHRDHYYGTLDTIKQYYWGDFHAIKNNGEKQDETNNN